MQTNVGMVWFTTMLLLDFQENGHCQEFLKGPKSPAILQKYKDIPKTYSEPSRVTPKSVQVELYTSVFFFR